MPTPVGAKARPKRGPIDPASMGNTLIKQRLVALFCCGWMLLNFPLLGLWDVDVWLLGVPLLPLALFTLWGGLIAALAWLMERRVADWGDD